MRQALILFGRVVKPHGLKGEICVEQYASSLFSFENIRRVYLQQAGKNPRPFALTSWRPHNGRLLVFLERIDGRDKALQWVGADFFVRKKDLPPPEEGELCLEDLTGFAACLSTGECLGVIQEFHDYGASPLAAVDGPDGAEILLPMPPEFIEDIDMEERKVVLVLPEGLLGI